MKNQHFIISPISIFLVSWLPLILCQQPYIGELSAACGLRDNSTSVLGYTCNGARRSCDAYLTYWPQPPYDSVAAISTLLAVNPSHLAQLNSVSDNAIFEANRVVLVPVTCSCSGQQYQANTSYVVRKDDTYLGIASINFGGLTTCQALQVQNGIPDQNLAIGARLTVPLRCACPTQSQADDGVNYLLSYLVTQNQFVSSISEIFGVDTGKTLAANGLSVAASTIYPSTTLLVPLQDPPTSSQVTGPQPQPPPPPSGTATPAPVSDGGSSKTWIYVVVGVVGGIALVSVVGAAVFLRRRKKRPEPVVSSQSFESVEKTLNKEGDDFDSQDFLESISSIAQSLKVYPFQQIKDATEDFSPSCWIKGSVYRGTINGDFAAIKKMSGGDVSKEISLLNKINHFNLIRLSGISFNEGSWYLVYEFASNGALVDWIHDKGGDQEQILNWDKRVQIALDVAAGLNYLHRYTSPPYIHKDLNSSNILLDRDFRAKIANFGLARATEGQEGQFSLTRHIVGTKGYMAPEYLENGVVSPKLDVYSYGVFLLEILTGKEVSILYEEVNTQLSEILTPVVSEGGQQNIGHLMDPLLQGNYPPDLALVLFRMVDNCLKKDPAERPNMDDIFQSVSRISTSVLSGEWAISIAEAGAGAVPK